MTRKNFNEIAQVIKSITDFTEKKRMARKIGLMCERQNPRFDWGKWYAGCGIDLKAGLKL